MRIKARFTRCPECKRLLIVDANNPFGRCTKVCREKNSKEK